MTPTDWRSRRRIGRRSPLRGLVARPENDVSLRGAEEARRWRDVVEAEWALWARLSVLFGEGKGDGA